VLRVRLRLSPQFRGLLIAVVERTHTAMTHSPAVPQGLTGDETKPDADLLTAWVEGLQEGNAGDTSVLMKLVRHPEFGEKDLPLSADDAEAVARAGVRVRLYLRETVLRDLSSAKLEGGTFFYGLPPAEQQTFACYRLLGHLEEDLLLQLDPSLAGG